MSHYPFVMQQALGIAPPPPDDSQRVANPTASTPIEFKHNWDWSENGPPHPHPQENVTTYMGPSNTSKAGYGLSWPEDNVQAIKTAIEIFRTGGYEFTVPKEFETERDDATQAEREVEYFQEHDYEEMKICKDNETVCCLKRDHDWLMIRCSTPQAAEFVESNFSDHYCLAPVRHTTSTILEKDGCTITQRTGNKENPGHDTMSISTMFELKKHGKVISKCLCSYRNGAMDTNGPTIEQFETAKAWQRHGHGTMLVDAIEKYFERVFIEMLCQDDYVQLYVTNVSSSHAGRWFEKRGFEDRDGMGEELGKYL